MLVELDLPLGDPARGARRRGPLRRRRADGDLPGRGVAGGAARLPRRPDRRRCGGRHRSRRSPRPMRVDGPARPRRAPRRGVGRRSSGGSQVDLGYAVLPITPLCGVRGDGARRCRCASASSGSARRRPPSRGPPPVRVIRPVPRDTVFGAGLLRACCACWRCRPCRRRSSSRCAASTTFTETRCTLLESDGAADRHPATRRTPASMAVLRYADAGRSAAVARLRRARHPVAFRATRRPTGRSRSAATIPAGSIRSGRIASSCGAA